MTRKGFTLVEAAVVVAMTGILAGMMAPLGMKALQQRREAVTRRDLKLAFEALFGARDRRVPNLRADFGFEPRGHLEGLPMLVGNVWGDVNDPVPRYGPNGGATFPWGYNGPYWQGPVMNGRPVDAWGTPLKLRYHPGGGGAWQVRSFGPDRAEGADDLVYPPVPAAIDAFKATVLVVIQRREGAIPGEVILRHGGNRSPRLTVLRQRLESMAPAQGLTFWSPPGGMELIFSPDGRAFRPLSMPMDLLPGETREVRVTL